jgi:hypothetical protein
MMRYCVTLAAAASKLNQQHKNQFMALTTYMSFSTHTLYSKRRHDSAMLSGHRFDRYQTVTVTATGLFH